jgi:outer membrane protein TolC
VTGALLLAAALAVGRAAPAESEGSISLAGAVAIAREASPAVAAARERAAAATSRARAASLYWLPALTLDSAWLGTDVPARAFAQKLNRGRFTQADFALDRLNDPGFDANLETSVELALPIDLFGSRGASARAEGARARAEAGRARGIEADVVLETTRAYLGLLAARQSAAAAQASLRAARALEEVVSARRDAGAALEADVLRVRSRRRRREVEVSRARSEEAVGDSRLHLLLGWASDRSLELSPMPEPDGPVPDLPEWTARALAKSPELAAADAEAQAPLEEYRRGRSDSWPALDVAASYQDDRSSPTTGKGAASVGVRLHWNVWDATRSPRIAAMRAAAFSAAAARKAVEDSVRLSVEASWRDIEVARMEAEAAREGRREADEVYRVVAERWRAGRAELFDVLDAESAQAAAAADEARSAVRVATAIAALERVAGGS